MAFGNDLVRGTTAPIVLRLLGERPMYGYEIVKLVRERTEGAFEWKEGTLYPCLHKLEADRLLRAAWRKAPSGKKRKYYRLTRKGRAELAKRVEAWNEFANSVDALLSD